ncbi:MAG: hypothetical protein AVDCRST_MAG73-1666, partial [uncultured Thermomicrobiales bacterium]
GGAAAGSAAARLGGAARRRPLRLPARAPAAAAPRRADRLGPGRVALRRRSLPVSGSATDGLPLASGSGRRVVGPPDRRGRIRAGTDRRGRAALADGAPGGDRAGETGRKTRL